MKPSPKTIIPHTSTSTPPARTSVRVVVYETYNAQARRRNGGKSLKRSKTVTVYGAGFTEIVAMVTLALNGAGSKSGKSDKS